MCLNALGYRAVKFRKPLFWRRGGGSGGGGAPPMVVSGSNTALPSGILPSSPYSPACNPPPPLSPGAQSRCSFSCILRRWQNLLSRRPESFGTASGSGRQGNVLPNSAAKPLMHPSNQLSGLVLRMHDGGPAHPPARPTGVGWWGGGGAQLAGLQGRSSSPSHHCSPAGVYRFGGALGRGVQWVRGAGSNMGVSTILGVH